MSAEPAPAARSSTRPRLGVLFSGGGRTLENLARSCRDGSLAADVVVAVSSHRGAGGVERAAEYGIPCEVVDYREHASDFASRIEKVIREHSVDLVLLAGFIRHFPVAPERAGRVLNIHPSLLPKFGGRGYYGERVHAAVLAAGETVSGCTVHVVTDEYDQGPIVVQRVVPVEESDTPASLAERVFREECIAYPEAVRLFAAGRVRIDGGSAVILPAD